MFTGIIAAIGEVVDLESTKGDIRLAIRSRTMCFDECQIGESIATNGVCLTVVDWLEEKGCRVGYFADVSSETLSLTTTSQWRKGDQVNLEKALTLKDRLGGHLVSGHVDGIGEVIDYISDARAWRYTLKSPANLAKFIAYKGSITVDGTSLTVNKVNGCEFELAIVPHTLENTIINSYRRGSQVNLEVDLLARYLERLMLGDEAGAAMKLQQN